MALLSKLAHAFTEYIDSGSKRYHMDMGYKMRKVPKLPTILEKITEFRTFGFENGDGPRIGLALGPDGFSDVNPKSLEFIQEVLRGSFQNHPEILKELEAPLPKNTIAVSFAERNFHMGKSCQKFVPSQEGSRTEYSFLSHQKLSANLQAVFFNQDDNCFLAGICYYPVLTGRATCFLNDRAAIHLIRASSEPFPLQDREKAYMKVQYGTYGRYCTQARKRVVVDCSGPYARHLSFDHFWNTYEVSTCDECLVDSVTYKWVEPVEEASLAENLPAPELEFNEPSTSSSDGSVLEIDHEDVENSDVSSDDSEFSRIEEDVVDHPLDDNDDYEDAVSDFEMI